MRKGWIAVALALSILWIFGIPAILSVATDVPYWFLFPNLPELSGLPLKKGMKVEVTPIVPTILGELITVRVLDAENNTALEEATVRVIKDSIQFNVTTKSDGIATFEYPGATTLVFVSKDGYNDAVPKVIPRIPDNWVTVRNYQYVTWIVALSGSWGPAVFLYRRQKKPPIDDTASAGGKRKKRISKKA